MFTKILVVALLVASAVLLVVFGVKIAFGKVDMPLLFLSILSLLFSDGLKRIDKK